jgi:hypothetical protein
MNTTPSDYREEVLKPFFKYVKSGESFFVIGAPSVGKTRLMDYLMGDDPDALRRGIEPDRERVKKYYLDAEAVTKTWLARVDMNRLRLENDWGFRFFELLLNTVLLACNRCESTDEIEKLKLTIAKLDSDVIESKDALKAHRLFEMAVNMLCQSYGIRLCFLLDEFDEAYKTMPRELFAHLRAIRDANKYRVSYILFLRNLPEKLRNPIDNEEFYELISRNMLGIGPYSRQDALYIIGQLEIRHELSLAQDKREWFYFLSGGHPGLIQALIKLLKDRPQAFDPMPNVEWCAKQESIQEEFRKIWNGLLENERAGLWEFAHGNQTTMSPATGKLLITKGLLVSTIDSGVKVFSPLFETWLSKQKSPVTPPGNSST